MKDRLLDFWCRMFHGRPMHPIHGQYICPRCLRAFPVPWEGPAATRRFSAHVVPITERRKEECNRSMDMPELARLRQPRP